MCACSVVSDSVQPHGLLPARLFCQWDSPGKTTGVGCHFLLQGSSHPGIKLMFDRISLYTHSKE